MNDLQVYGVTGWIGDDPEDPQNNIDEGYNMIPSSLIQDNKDDPQNHLDESNQYCMVPEILIKINKEE